MTNVRYQMKIEHFSVVYKSHTRDRATTEIMMKQIARDEMLSCARREAAMFWKTHTPNKQTKPQWASIASHRSASTNFLPCWNDSVVFFFKNTILTETLYRLYGGGPSCKIWDSMWYDRDPQKKRTQLIQSLLLQMPYNRNEPYFIFARFPLTPKYGSLLGAIEYNYRDKKTMTNFMMHSPT